MKIKNLMRIMLRLGFHHLEFIWNLILEQKDPFRNIITLMLLDGVDVISQSNSFISIMRVQSFFATYNPGQNIWNKIEKFSKIGQIKKCLISFIASFFTTIAKV